MVRKGRLLYRDEIGIEQSKRRGDPVLARGTSLFSFAEVGAGQNEKGEAPAAKWGRG